MEQCPEHAAFAQKVLLMANTLEELSSDVKVIKDAIIGTATTEGMVSRMIQSEKRLAVLESWVAEKEKALHAMLYKLIGAVIVSAIGGGSAVGVISHFFGK